MGCYSCLSLMDPGHKKCPYCGHNFDNTNPNGTLPANTVLAGRYTLDKVAAIDGEGVTYRASDAKFKRRVIIKEYLPATICSQRTPEGHVIPRKDKEVYFKTTRMDFMDLYRSLMTVEQTEGLCKVYNLFELNNTAYAVQEVPVGRSLEKFLASRPEPLSAAQAISLLRPIVYAIEAMHRKGLLHRGVSTKTIYINSKGQAKLSGFATIGLRTADSDLKSQLFEGYSAPEQYSASEFDGKYTDVYGLAAVFYRAITGVCVPVADRRKQHDSIISPRNIVDTIPTFVSVALMRALRIAGTQRMQTTPELLSAITEPNLQKVNEKFIKNRNEKNNLITIVTLAVCLIVALALTLVLLLDVFDEQEPISSSVGTSQSESVQIEAEPELVKVPALVNESYAQIAQNEEYISNFLFIITEEYSSTFDEGNVMDQTPKEGESVEIGTTINLIVSRGPMLVAMPNVVGLSKTDAIATLNAHEIQYTIVAHINDGSYAQDEIVKSDYDVGDMIDPSEETVTIFYAGAPPAPSSSASEPTSSSDTPTP